MKFHRAKFFIGISIVLAYMSIGVFGLLLFNHTGGMPMETCPYTQNGHSICRDNLDHITSWRQFSNAIFPSLFAFLGIIFGVVLHFLGKHDFLNQPPNIFHRRKRYLENKFSYTYKEKIIKWLSLFENSPSLSYVRHS